MGVFPGKGGKPIVIDLEDYLIHFRFSKKKVDLHIMFNNPSRKFYCAVIALVVIEMKKKQDAMPSQGMLLSKYEKELDLLDRAVAGWSETEGRGLNRIIQRISVTWKTRLNDLEKAPTFEIDGRKRGEAGEEHLEQPGKAYRCTDEETDSWTELFQRGGAGMSLRLNFSLRHLGLSLDDVMITYAGKTDQEAWEAFKSDAERGLLQRKRARSARYHKQAEPPQIPPPTVEETDAAIIRKYIDSLKSNPHMRMVSFFGKDIDIMSHNAFIARLLAPLSDAGNKGKDELPFSAIEILDDAFESVFIHGEPGIGKTTLLKYLMIYMAESFDLHGAVPIFVSLYEYSKSLDEEPSSLLSYAIDRSAKSHFLTTGRPAFEQALARIPRNRMVFFLDGFDEVRSHVQTARREIRALTKSSRVMLTSRTMNDTSDLGFKKTYALPPLDIEAEGALRSMIARIGPLFGMPEDTQKLLLLHLENNEQMRQFVRIPFYLVGLCFSVKSEKDCPIRRVDLYKAVAERFLRHHFEKGFAKQGLEEFYFSKTRNELTIFEYIYGSLAYTWFENLPFPKSAVTNSVDEGVEAFHAGGDKLDINDIILKSGIITEIDFLPETHCRFFHDSLMEYFVALYLLRTDRWPDVVHANYINPSWKNVILLLAGLLGHENFHKLYTLLLEKPDYFHNGLLLAAEAINELQCYPRELRQILRRLKTIVTSHPLKDDIVQNLCRRRIYSSREILFSLFRRTYEVHFDDRIPLENIGSKRLHQKMLKLLHSNEDQPLRILAMSVLTNIGIDKDKTADALLRILEVKAEDPQVQSGAAFHLGFFPPSRKAIAELLERLEKGADAAETLKRRIAGTLAHMLDGLSQNYEHDYASRLLRVLKKEKDSPQIAFPIVRALAACGFLHGLRALEYMLRLQTTRSDWDRYLGCVYYLVLRARRADADHSSHGSLRASADKKDLYPKISLNNVKQLVRMVLNKKWFMHNQPGSHTATQVHVLRELGRIEPEYIMGQLVKKVRSTHNSRVLRETCFQALNEIGCESHTDIIINLLKDNDYLIGAAAVKFLANHWTEQAESALIETLTAENPQTDLLPEVIEVLGDKKSKRAILPLLDIAESRKRTGDPEMPIHALASLAELGQKSVFSKLLSIVDSPDEEPWLRSAALGYLRYLDAPDVTGQCITILSRDEPALLKRDAIRALDASRSIEPKDLPTVVSLLISAIRNKDQEDYDVPRTATVALANIAEEGTIDALIVDLNDPENPLYCSIFDTLLRKGSVKMLWYLVERLKGLYQDWTQLEGPPDCSYSLRDIRYLSLKHNQIISPGQLGLPPI